MLGNYKIENNKIKFVGNKVVEPIDDVRERKFKPMSSNELFASLSENDHYYHLHVIDNAVFFAAVEYFKQQGVDWCNLPLTTKMISSPGEIYAGKKLDYTTDALPVNLKWFDSEDIYLAESSQFYLEIRLVIDQLDKVFSIYNSFRKEATDFSHLVEFQHIEFEGIVSFEENIEMYVGLLRHVTNYIVTNHRDSLAHYLTDEEIDQLQTSFDEKNITTITFKDTMKLLHENLGDHKYKKVTLENFGSYEEVALTRILNTHANVIEFPIEEIPFYHDASFTDKEGKKYAKNADFILLGYREVIGSGRRITDLEAIQKKAEFFNLPKEDYEPYIDLRKLENYKETCGFGLGWQRYVQWLTKMPYIWDVSHIPRGEHTPRP